MTYTMGLKFLVDEGTSEASTVSTMSTDYVNPCKQYIHDLFGLGMAIGPAVLGYVILICLGSLVHMFER
jgi:aromatic ring-opening dioxygenase catalytic subunit (LigB family)